MLMFIDIESDEKKEQVRLLFYSFNKIGDIYKYYGVSDNSKNIKYLKSIAKEIGFDLSYYKQKHHKFCKNCGKEITGSGKLFCSKSCSAKYNNRKRGPRSQETKEKIRKALTKSRQTETFSKAKTVSYSNKTKSTIGVCLNCKKEYRKDNKNRKFCSRLCQSEYKHKLAYKDFLTNPEKYCNGGYTPKSFKPDILNEQGGVCCIEGCGQTTIHNGKPLVFVLDHIDGDCANNRRENLRMICPNCDSQLDTFKSKNKRSSRTNYWKEYIRKTKLLK